MSPNPMTFLDHLRTRGYHSRSNKHSDALSEAIAADLIRHCPRIQEKARNGQLVYDLNFKLLAGTADWNVDLVLGAPPIDSSYSSAAPGGLVRRPPSTVEIAIELKAVMTEHRKAVKNRKRDLEAHHEHVHNYSSRAIAAGVLIVNAAPRFQSPLRQEISYHRNPRHLVEHCISELRSVAARGGPTGYGLEARCAIVVEMENIPQKNGSTHIYPDTTFLSDPPAPRIGDPLHYDAFIQTICRKYTARF